MHQSTCSSHFRRERSTHGQFYSTGRKLLGLLDGHVEQVRKVLAASRRSRADNQRVAQLDRTQKQSQALRQTLLSVSSLRSWNFPFADLTLVLSRLIREIDCDAL